MGGGREGSPSGRVRAETKEAVLYTKASRGGDSSARVANAGAALCDSNMHGLKPPPRRSLRGSTKLFSVQLLGV